MTDQIVYLAAPYTDPDPGVRLDRFHKVTEVAARMIERGELVYSPLTMTHPIDLVLAEDGATMGSNYWVRYDEAFMSFCTKIVVLKLPGWQASSGVKREIEFFRAAGCPIEYITYEEGSARS